MMDCQDPHIRFFTNLDQGSGGGDPGRGRTHLERVEELGRSDDVPAQVELVHPAERDDVDAGYVLRSDLRERDASRGVCVRACV